MEKEGRVGLREWFADRGIKHVLFDMDSTLVVTRDHFFNKMDEYCGFLEEKSGEDRREIFDLFLTGIVSLRDEFQVHPVVVEVPARVMAKMHGVVEGPELEDEIDELMKIYEVAPKTFQGAVEQVRQVRDAGVDVFGVTQAGEEWTLKKRADFIGLFKEWVCTRVDRPKDVLAWQKAMEKLGVRPDEVMVVGDSWKSDMEPVLEMGVKKVVWVKNGIRAENDDGRVIEIGSIADLVEELLSN
jgi:putative hydrolase of the HAD superfamily